MASIPGAGRSLGGGHGTPVFLPGESQGPRSLAGYRPRGRSDTAELTHSLMQRRHLEGSDGSVHKGAPTLFGFVFHLETTIYTLTLWQNKPKRVLSLAVCPADFVSLSVVLLLYKQL